ncbi:hypothetical protein C5F50_08875 [Nitrosopumilus ureiphilus]|uniref:Sialidase domain-containing protein n=1 Tax=Nitrosopumilus ureiphilus TaxID=1470067 RepID=A0A7D5R6R5_9ARCH|nr:hypothetical protein C5F50_08875 [Nitrosopumilus ureiphilus]
MVLIGMVGIVSHYDEGYFAFGHHEDEQETRFSNPLVSVHNDKANIIWESYNQNSGSAIMFTQLSDGKTTIAPKDIATGSFIGNIKILSQEQHIFVFYELSTRNGNAVPQFYVLISDDGKTFSEPKLILTVDDVYYGITSVEFVNEKLYVFGTMWTREENTSYAFYSVSDDFGNTFSEPSKLFNQGKVRQDIVTTTSNGVIYLLMDDEKDFDEKGSLYLRKILSDGTLTDIVNVNGGKTTVTYPQFAVSGENVYVSWRDRVHEKGNFGITERWYQVFTKSHDGGKTFDDVITFDSDPKSIDTVGTEGNFVFAHGNSVYVLWKSEYYDGETQSFKTYLAYSDNRGKDFTIESVPLNDELSQHGYMISKLDKNNFYQIGMTSKNPPFNDAAVYFTSRSLDADTIPVDILKDISTQIGWMPDFATNENNVYFVTEGNNDQSCILYSYSNDGGKSFSDVVNISPNGTPKTCLGIEDEITSPKHQTNLGTDIEDIRCNDDRTKGYILALRERDDQPICVTSASYDKLSEREIISDQSFETIAQSAAKNYLLSHPKISSIVDDSLVLEIFMTRHSIPPAFVIRGSFETISPIYENDSDPFNHSVEITLVQNNKVHLALIDETYSLFESDLKEERHPRLDTIVSPTLKTILSPGDRINNKGLIPLIITEVSQGGYDKTTHWTFQSIGYQGDNRDERWGFLPDQYRITETVDEFGNDAIDRERMPENFGIPLPLFTFPVLCGDERIEGESGWHYTLPTRNDTSMVYFRSTDKGIYPDDNGVYDIRFVSLFKPEVELQPNAKVITNETILCPLEKTSNDATHAYYTKLEFQIDDNWTASYYSPKSNIGSDDIHEHATILAKIFGDTFDFTQSNFQLKNPQINFEPAQPNVIHRTSQDATIGFLFETLGMNLSSQCFVFYDGREFCNNDEYELKFYINDQKRDDISEYVLSEDDRILISYGSDNEHEINEQLSELESMAQYNYFSLEKLMNIDVGTVSDGTYDSDLGFETVKKLIEFDMKRQEEKTLLENDLYQKQTMYDELVEQSNKQLALESISDEIKKLETQLAELTKNKFQYTTEEIFQKVGEIESENILMYKLRPEKYQEYADAKIALEDTIKEDFWNGKSLEEKMQAFPLVSVQINPNDENLEVMLSDVVKYDAEKIKQFESVIENTVPDNLSWTIIFSDDE